MSFTYTLLIDKPYIEIFKKDPAPNKEKVLKIVYSTSDNKRKMEKFSDNTKIYLDNIVEIEEAYYYVPKKVLIVKDILINILKKNKNELTETNTVSQQDSFNIPSETNLVKEVEYNKIDNIEYSVVMPVYNQETIITKNINSIINNIIGTFEIFIILDFCFDKTKQMIMKFLQKNHNSMPKSLNRIVIFENKEIPLFETKCDNIGFKNSLGKYCLEIQADMEMCEYGFNKQLTRPFEKIENVIAVSGRCTHNLFGSFKGVGKTGININKPIEKLGVDRNKFYSMETCNRGPLLIEREKLVQLNYLDEAHYFLGGDDHDLMARAYLNHKYICGYTPINFNAPLSHGSCRSRNKINNEKMKKINQKELKRNRKIKNSNYVHIHKKRWKSRKIQIYNLEKYKSQGKSNEFIITDNMILNPINLNKKPATIIYKQETSVRNAYVLTGDIYSKRYQFVSRLLSKIGFTVIPVIYIKHRNRVISNKNSMLAIYNIIFKSNSNINWSYVFEDDVNIISKNLKLKDIIKYESISKNVFFLGMCDADKKSWVKTSDVIDNHCVLQKRGGVRGLHAIGLSKKGAQSLFKFAKKSTGSYMDVVLERFTLINSANVMRSDLISPCHGGHRGMFYQDRKAFASTIS